MVLLFVSAFSALSTLDFLVVFAVGGYVIRFTAISTLATSGHLPDADSGQGNFRFCPWYEADSSHYCKIL